MRTEPLYPITHVCVLPPGDEGRVVVVVASTCHRNLHGPPVLVSLDWTDYGQEAVAPWPRERSTGLAALPKRSVVGNAIRLDH